MISVNSIDTIPGIIKKVKDLSKGYLTNFFPDAQRIGLWIKADLLTSEEAGETVFICRKNNGFYNQFFITCNTQMLARDIELFLLRHPLEEFVVDIIGKGNDIKAVKEVFAAAGFHLYTSLVRMSKMNNIDLTGESGFNNIYYADKPKANEVNRLLQTYFDPYAEQLPLIEEIYALADRNEIIIYSDDNQTIQGFLIFELIGFTSYLRYWFVHPDHREKRIGSALLRRFFAEGKETRRQLFWVIESNENAIKRYEHFGFIKESLFDYIMINKNIHYEG